MKVRPPRFPVVLMFMYFCVFFICGLNWWWFVSFERALFGDAIVDAHLAFNIIGGLAFGLIGSPFLFWPYRYGPQMLPRQRRNCFFFALCTVYLFHDFPLWLMEFWFVWQYGWMHVLQGISIFTLTFSTAFGTFGVWLGYAWKMSKVLQTYYGSSKINATGNLGSLAVARVGSGVDQMRI